MKKLFGLVILAPAFVLAWTANVLADDTLCPPALGPVTVDNVIVIPPIGIATCDLFGTTVTGNVEVDPGGHLRVFGGTTIAGNVQSDGGLIVVFVDPPVSVGGDVQLKGLTGVISGYSPGVLTVGGNFQYEENAAFLIGEGATIGGDFKFEKNTGGGVIGGNTIGGNLQCKENFPAPVPGLAVNIVSGNKEDECSGLGF